jgi:flavin-dependent dehydrogenase
MPVRATKRGSERTPLPQDARYDVVICGASFAGLAVARELRASRARVLVLDRYEIGERQTSACCAPTSWLVNLGLEGGIRQTFPTMVMHTMGASVRWHLPEPFSTFDYRAVCELLWKQCGDAEFETAKVDGRTGSTVHTDRGDVHGDLIVDCLGWRRVLGTSGEPIQPPEATLSRGLEVHPSGSGPDLQLWVDPRYVPSGYGWSFPAGDELRIGIGSYDPRFHVKEPTVRLAADERAGCRPRGPDPAPGARSEGETRSTFRYQGNWIPHRFREATDDGIFFVGDSAGHCIPLSAEGIRTAWYFGIACGRELAAVLAGRRTHEAALEGYAAFHDAHRWKFEWMYINQQAIRFLHGRPLDTVARLSSRPRLTRWLFRKYLNVAPAAFALPAPAEAPASLPLAA